MLGTYVLVAVIISQATTQRIWTKEERQQLLDAHNYYRRLTVKEDEASDMYLMEWNNALEEFAFNYLKKCKYEHSAQEDRSKVGGEGTTGENLYWTSASSVSNLSEPVWLWFKEREDWDYYTTKCKEEKVCGHYTQVVWGNSYKLGCAATSKDQCDTGSILACNYAPAGNFRGRKEYEKGQPCTSCTGDWAKHCIQNLCSTTAEPKPLPEAFVPKGSSGYRTLERSLKMLPVLTCIIIARVSW